MKKSDLPKPRYDIGSLVIATLPAPENVPAGSQRKAVKVERIRIDLNPSGASVTYQFEDDPEWYAQSVIGRRVIA